MGSMNDGVRDGGVRDGGMKDGGVREGGVRDWSNLSEACLRQALEGKNSSGNHCDAQQSGMTNSESGIGSDFETDSSCRVDSFCSDPSLSDLFDSARLETPSILQSLDGVGPSLALRILAAHEVGRRSQQGIWKSREPFRSSRQVHDHLARRWLGDAREHFCLLLLDVRHRLIRDCVISIGSLTASIVHPREVFRPAVIHSAAAVILAHNHPSGDPDPSAEDLRVTHRLYRCGQWLGIPVLDHVICGRGDWCSLRESALGPWSGSSEEEPFHDGISPLS